MPQTYAQYRDTINALITEMEATTPSDPDDRTVSFYRRRLARLRGQRVADMAATVSLDSRDKPEGDTSLLDDCCPVCGLTIYDRYAGGVHSSACDRLRDDSLICIEECDDEDCEICSV